MTSLRTSEEWGPNLPPPGPLNAKYLCAQAARHGCRQQFKYKVDGRLLDSSGSNRVVVRWYHGTYFYLTPCRTVRMGDIPLTTTAINLTVTHTNVHLIDEQPFRPRLN